MSPFAVLIFRYILRAKHSRHQRHMNRNWQLRPIKNPRLHWTRQKWLPTRLACDLVKTMHLSSSPHVSITPTNQFEDEEHESNDDAMSDMRCFEALPTTGKSFPWRDSSMTMERPDSGKLQLKKPADRS